MSKIDSFLDFATNFDIVSGVGDYIAGYNKVEFEGSEKDCKTLEKKLKAQGVKCRTYFTGSGWQVISKR